MDSVAISIPTSEISIPGVNDKALTRRKTSRSRSPIGRGRDVDCGDRRIDSSRNSGKNLHVKGLSRRVDNRDLEEAFAKIGRVQKAQVMFDPHTRDSRGFGFVTMESPEEAEAAITALNATELFGKVITVEKARRSRARTPTPGQYCGPPRKNELRDRPYDPRPYDSRYASDWDRDGYRGARSWREEEDRRRSRDRDRDYYRGRDYDYRRDRDGRDRDHSRDSYNYRERRY